jgi:hypothetical protein
MFTGVLKMPSWHIEPGSPASPLGRQRSAGRGPDDDEPPAADEPDPSSSDESRRIVEEAIRRLEEAEHEWSRSWEPDKPAE